MPGTASNAMETDSLPFSLAALTSTPLPSAQACTGQRSKVPPAVTSTTLPCCAPAGKKWVKVGGAADAVGRRTTRHTATSRIVERRKVMLVDAVSHHAISSLIGVASLT